MSRLPRLLALIFALFVIWGCNKDEEEMDPVPEIRARLNFQDENNQSQSRNWSLPSVSLIRTNGDLVLSATNNATGETFFMRVPDNGVGYYSNVTDNNDQGYAGWSESTNSLFLYSNALPEGTSGNFVLDIQSINTSSNTARGAFFTEVYNPSNGNDNVFFQNGRFSNVPVIELADSDEITENRVSFKLGGINFNPVSIEVTQIEAGTDVIISATDATASTLEFTLPLSALNEDTFEVDAGEIDVWFEQPPDNSFEGISGTLVVEEHNQGAETIKGTFEFAVGQNGMTNYSLTEGSFQILY